MAASESLPGSSVLIEGPFHGSLVLIGPPGSGKSVYCKQFLGKAVENGSVGIYATTDSSTAKVQEGLALLGFDVEKQVKTGGLRFLDLRSVVEEKPAERQIGIRSWLRGPSGKGPLAQVAQRIEDSVSNLESPILVVDTMTSLLLHSNEEEFLPFLQLLLDQLKTKRVMSLFSLTLGGHSEKFTTMTRSMFDGVLELKVDESSGSMRRLLRVFSLKGTPHKSNWLSFSITDRGLAIEEPSETRCALCSKPVGDEPIKYEMPGQTVYFDNRDCFTNYRKLKSVYGDTFL